MLDHELRALVSVEPPVDFQARVRIRIAGEPSRRWWLSPRAGVLALSAAVVAALLVILWPVAVPNHTDAPTVARLLTNHAADRLAPLASAVPAERPTVTPTTHVATANNLGHIASKNDGHIAFDRAETLALQRLFASARAESVTDMTALSEGPLVFPEIVIAPLLVGASKEGASR